MKNMIKVLIIKLTTSICLLVATQSFVKAEPYYCWAMSGLLVRAQPTPNAKVLGKLEYGQQVEIKPENILSGIYHKVLFLPGVDTEEETTESIYLEDYWVSIDYNNMEGFVFRGYLSRWPTFKIKAKTGDVLVENFTEYLIRAFDNDSTELAKLDINNGDDISSVAVCKPGITIIKANNPKGLSGQYVMANMTINEALLFVYFSFGAYNKKLPDDPKLIYSMGHFYGLKYSEDYIEINYPAPGGSITIQKIDIVILISYHASC